MVDLLDFGGKYLYLRTLYTTSVDHDYLKQVAYYTTTISLGILTLLLTLILLSPFGRHTPPVIPVGCRKYGRSRDKQSLLSKPPPKASPSSSSSNGKPPPTVQSLWLYPIKSCAGIELDEAEIIDTGIKYDRQFSFAQLHSPFPLSVNDSKESKSAHQWRFITQREFPLLSQVRTELWLPNPFAQDYAPDAPYVKTGGAIVVYFPYEEDGWLPTFKSLISRLRSIRSRNYNNRTEKSFLIPYAPDPKTYPLEPFKIWKDTPLALNMATNLPAAELKYFLGVRNPLTLFRVHTQQKRMLFRNAPRKAELGWQPIVGFADAYPLNLLGMASLEALSRMQQPPGGGAKSLTFQRFRANVALAGLQPFEEETWKMVRIGAEVYHVCCRCVRCGIPNVDPDTGVKDAKGEPYRTLVSRRNVDAGAPMFGCLAVQLVPVRPGGVVRVGDEVEVLACGEHVYEPM